MHTLTVKTEGAAVGSQWFGPGLYQVPVDVKFDGPGYYWLKPQADPQADHWEKIGIDMGLCHSEAELNAAVAKTLKESEAMEDPIWLLGATTVASVFISGHIG